MFAFINRHVIYPILAVSLFFFIGPVACGKQKDDAAVLRELIAKGAASAEAHAIGDLMEMTTPDVSATPGSYDEKTLRGVLFATFRHYGKFSLHYPKPSVRLENSGREAVTLIRFIIVRREHAFPGLKELYDDPEKWLRAAGEKADLYELTLSWIKTREQWKIRKAHLEGFRGTQF